MSEKSKKRNSIKPLILLLVLVLLVGCVVGGTIAWLMTETQPVTNTFVAGKIGELTLVESETADLNGDGKKNDYLVVPGVAIAKDPKVSFANNGDVDAYVFVKIETVGANKWVYDNGTFTVKYNNAAALSFTIADGWTALDGQPGVFYREVDKTVGLSNVSVIAGDTITVYGASITVESMPDIINAANNLKFTAYAIQKNAAAVADAWTLVSTP